MHIALLESFYGGSHRSFADGLVAHSRHDWGLFTLPDRHWKWRMHDGAAALAEQLLASGMIPDLVMCTSLMDVAALRGYLHQAGLHAPVLVYFHENQLAYPCSPQDRDQQAGYDNHYAYLNYSSALVADGVVFNSAYNRDSFLQALPKFLQQFPDSYRSRDIEAIQVKSRVLPVGLTLTPEIPKPLRTRPLVLWNHRWAHDKGPDLFFESLMVLSEEGAAFDLAVAGPSWGRAPGVFARAKARLTQHLIHWGPASHTDYLQLLRDATLLPVTAQHEFFGVAVLEAVHRGVRPLLPKRLVYPEHFSDASLFYTSDAEFLHQLRKHLLTPSPCPEAVQAVPARYGWTDVAPQFDQYFDSFVP